MQFRFGSVERGWNNGNYNYALIFCVNSNILLHGVYLFGSKGNNYSVNLTIKRLPTYATVVSTSGTFPSLLHKSKKFWGFDVLIEPPVSLSKGNRYLIQPCISGRKSFGGRHGSNRIESSGVIFNFENSEVSIPFLSGVEQGQIPEFIFSLQR